MFGLLDSLFSKKIEIGKNQKQFWNWDAEMYPRTTISHFGHIKFTWLPSTPAPKLSSQQVVIGTLYHQYGNAAAPLSRQRQGVTRSGSMAWLLYRLLIWHMSCTTPVITRHLRAHHTTWCDPEAVVKTHSPWFKS